MCKIYGDYVISPKVVGDYLEAGTYIRNDDDTIPTSKVYLSGYNIETKARLTFAETVPEQSTGWAGMPLITLTDAHVGTWTMSWDAPGVCGAGPYTLVVTKTATPIFLSSDKMSIQQGDTVTFTGKYKPGATVNIYEDQGILFTKHITKTVCDGSGEFEAVVYNFNLEVSDQPHKIFACDPGLLIGTECYPFGDISGAIYIYVHPKQACTPSWNCIQPLNGVESDGCGHTRDNPACNPPPPPPPPPPGPCQPPKGERYCVDSQTIAIWNSTTCRYDTIKCSTGVCKEGYCTQSQAGTDNTMLIAISLLIIVLFFVIAGKK